MLKSLAKAVLGVVTVPVAILADVVTMGGVITDKGKPYIVDQCKDIFNNLKDATKPERD